MKRSIHLSSDLRTPNKTVKLDPITQKKRSKQNLSKNPSSIPSNLAIGENSLSPKLTRNIKSQIDFSHIQRTELPNKAFPVLSNSKSPPKIIEKFQSENEINTPSAEVLAIQLKALQKEADGFKLSHNQTVAKIGLLEKKLFRAQFQEKTLRLPEKISEEHVEEIKENEENGDEGCEKNEDFENGKVIKIEQSEVYKELEELYRLDTNALKKDLERLNGVIKCHDMEISTYRSKIEIQNIEMQEIQKKLSAEITEKENQKKRYEDIIADKNGELNQMLEFVNKVKLDRKIKDESLKDFQRQVLILTNCNKILDNDLNSTKRALSIAQEALETEKEKTKFFNAQSQELSDLLTSKELSDSKLRETLKSLDFVTNNYQFLQNKYNNLKEDFEQKEFQLKDALEKFVEAPPTQKILSRPTFRRTATFNATSLDNEPSQKETFSRLYSKISNLEEELQSEKIEKEKLSRNLDYLKKIIDEKLQIIVKLEAKIKSDYLMQVETVKESLRNVVNEHITLCEDSIYTLQQLMTCSKCKTNPEVKFITQNCEHFLCKSCIAFRDTCPVCPPGFRLFKLKLLKRLYFKLPLQLDALSAIRTLFKPSPS